MLESRSASYRPGGKADTPLKTSVSEEVAQLVAQKARALGVTTAEYLRDLVMENVYGVDVLLSMHENYLKGLVQKGTSNGTNHE
jgi:hypothetical protein